MSNHDMECGHCSRTWNDRETPTPAARCPYEYDHEYTDTKENKMESLSNPLTLEMIRDAASEIVNTEMAWAKYETEISEHVDELITMALEELAGAIESEPVTSRDEVEDIVSDFCDEVAGSLEMSLGNGFANEMVGNDVIYTSDILDYYMANAGDVDEALSNAYGDLGEFETISDAMAVGVTLALESIANSEITEVMNAFEDPNGIVDHIFA